MAGGFNRAPARGRDLGALAIQIFTRPPQQWAAVSIPPEMGAAFQQALEDNGIVAAVAHAIYLINLASPKDDLWRRSIDGFVGEIERCATLGIERLIIHPGSCRGEAREWGLRRVLEALEECAVRTARTKVGMLLEITAGGGSTLGATIEEMAWIISRYSTPGRLGLCLDTAHAFTSGYPLHEPHGLERLLDEVESAIGLDKLGCLHVNDSATPWGSHRDRHARIGRGALGREFFRRLLAEERLFGRPKILEIPGGDQFFAEDLKLLARLAPKEKKCGTLFS